MYDQLISFETAKLAKEKGFNLNCENFFFEGRRERDPLVRTAFGEIIEAPSQTFLQRWLRIHHHIHVSVIRETIGSDEWVWAHSIEYLPKEHWEAKRRVGFFKIKYSYMESPGGTYWGGWNTYEEAMEKGLEAGLKLIV